MFILKNFQQNNKDLRSKNNNGINYFRNISIILETN